MKNTILPRIGFILSLAVHLWRHTVNPFCSRSHHSSLSLSFQYLQTPTGGTWTLSLREPTWSFPIQICRSPCAFKSSIFPNVFFFPQFITQRQLWDVNFPAYLRSGQGTTTSKLRSGHIKGSTITLQTITARLSVILHQQVAGLCRTQSLMP